MERSPVPTGMQSRDLTVPDADLLATPAVRTFVGEEIGGGRQQSTFGF